MAKGKSDGRRPLRNIHENKYQTGSKAGAIAAARLAQVTITKPSDASGPTLTARERRQAQAQARKRFRERGYHY